VEFEGKVHPRKGGEFSPLGDLCVGGDNGVAAAAEVTGEAIGLTRGGRAGIAWVGVGLRGFPL
jgi:hypothetical protein